MRVLILPSWYPKANNRELGIFSYQQARSLSGLFDIRVAYLMRRNLSRRAALLNPGIFWKLWRGNVFWSREVPLFENEPWTLRLNADYLIGLLGAEPLEEEVARVVFEEVTGDGWLPDLIHAHCALHAGRLAHRISGVRSIPYVITEHQQVTFEFLSSQDWKQALTVYQHAERIAVVSHFQRWMMQINGVQKDMTVVGNLVDETVFHPGTKPRSPSEFKVLFVGWNAHMKDVTTLLKVLHALSKTITRFRAVLIVPFTSEIEQRALKDKLKSDGISGHVEIRGRMDHHQVAEAMRDSDVLLSTSIAETFGVSVCEAIMSGVPVVVTDSGGIRDFVVDGVNGYIVNVGDWKAMVERVEVIASRRGVFDPNVVRNSVLLRYGTKAFNERMSLFYHGQSAEVSKDFPSYPIGIGRAATGK